MWRHDWLPIFRVGDLIDRWGSKGPTDPTAEQAAATVKEVAEKKANAVVPTPPLAEEKKQDSPA